MATPEFTKVWKKHSLPETYEGICRGNQPYVPGFVSEGKRVVKGADGKETKIDVFDSTFDENGKETRTFHKYEFRMAVPSVIVSEENEDGEVVKRPATVEELEADIKRLYGEKATLDLFLRQAVLSFSRSADDKAKPELFDGKDEPTEAKHLAMQRVFEGWKPGTREVSAVSQEQALEKAIGNQSQEELIEQLFKIGKINQATYDLIKSQAAAGV
jgi:hypothetical protein